MPRITPSNPTGTLELLPIQQIRLQNIIDTIRHTYELYGFTPIETPLFEKKSLLLHNSNTNTQKQVYLTQSSGAWQQNHNPELAIRFDLTVPLARYVAQYERQIPFPFRRYQIQRVYRGERPQKGRYREFYQCDIDIINKNHLNLIHDTEILTILVHLLQKLNLSPFTIHLNHRALIYGILEVFNVTQPQLQYSLIQTLDKSHKTQYNTTYNSISSLLKQANPNTTQTKLSQITQQFLSLLQHKEHPNSILQTLKSPPFQTPLIQQAIQDIQTLLTQLQTFGVSENCLTLDLCIVRGLDYYTGIVYETFLNNYPQLGSICSGGRYENLTQNYTKSFLPGVGLSLGLTRLFAHLLTQNTQHTTYSSTSILITNIDPNLQTHYIHLATQLRSIGINTLLYHETEKLAKQLKYAQQSHIPWTVIIGSQEQQAKNLTIKSLTINQQHTIPLEKFLLVLQKHSTTPTTQHPLHSPEKFFSLFS